MPYKFNPFTGKLDNAPGAPVFKDNKFRVVDDGDPSKRVALEVSGVSPSTTRTLTVQDQNGPIAVGYGAANQYIRGDATIANFPVAAGGGSSVSYYFNGSVSQGTILGNPYYEINKIPAGAVQTNFTINAGSTTAYFITDAGDPNLLLIPQGNFTFQLYCLTSSGNPQLAVELYKYDGASFTQIGTTSPAVTIANTNSDIHFLTVAIPASTTLTLTDRLAVRVIGSSLGGHTITLNTEGNTQSQIITTFSTGLAALNGLTDQIQFFATGTTGTDFNIASSAATHTFNIPVASGTNTGKLSSADWTTFNNKIGAGLYTATTGLTMNTARLLGRTTAGVGAAEEITVGTGLSLAGGTLTATAGAAVTNVTATAPITSSGGATPDISTSIATNRIVGRSTAGTGVMEELTPVGITVSGGNITGIGGTVGTVDNAVPRADGTGGYTAQGSNIVIDDVATATQDNVAIVNASGATNSSLVLTPKGTGAFILGPKPNGAASGGNSRGIYAVDLQVLRTNANEVPGDYSLQAGYACRADGNLSGAFGNSNRADGYRSLSWGGEACRSQGTNSATISGHGNLASGNRSIVAGGGDSGGGNTASATYSATFGGNRSLADRYAMQAHAAGQFAAQGDAQRARFVLRNSTANNTPTELFLDGSSTRLTIPVNKAMGFTIQVIGSIQGMAENSYFVRKGMIVNDNATTTLVGSVESVGTDQKSAGATATDVTVTASDANDALIITVTGIAAQNWRWVASVDAVEVQYA